MEEPTMPSRLGPIEIVCDAPPYSIIQACSRIGIRNPEDVRWCRMSHFIAEADSFDPIHLHPWRSFLGVAKGGRVNCSCGQALPSMEKCTFTFITGREVSYFIGQCQRCRTVFWENS
jgi:hypothetical protein